MSDTIVIDLGCATYEDYPEDESVLKLIDRFHPSVLFGFDPNPSLVTTAIFERGCRVLLERRAAWTYDGFIGFSVDWNRLRGTTGEMMGPAAVPCFDIAKFIRELPEGELIVKMDIETAEYELVPHLMSQGVMGRISLLLIEWHGEPLPGPFDCPVEIW